MRFLTVVFAASLAAACSTQAPQRAAAACAMSERDAAWSRAAVEGWEFTRAKILALAAPSDPPTVVLFDATCVHRSDGGGDWKSAPHNGAVSLPDGKTLPPRVTSFAAPYDNDRRAFQAMALPSIWAAGGVTSTLGLETLMTAVFIHEMTHTSQFYYFAPRLADVSVRYKLGDDLDDNVVQTRFEAVPEISVSIAAERDLLFRAATAVDAPAVRDLARRARMQIDARRAAYFAGADIRYAELEDLFLTMEGIAQWASYRWLIEPRGGKAGPAALDAFRRGGRRWSQDEGLALFLVIDRLVPDWRARAFAPRPATALELLALAVE